MAKRRRFGDGFCNHAVDLIDLCNCKLEAENLVMDGSIRPPAPPRQQASLIK
jgi:hypothetical protein